MEPAYPSVPSAERQSTTSRSSHSPTASRRSRPRTQTAQTGDIVLKSIDGHEFTAHSIILSLSSPVFADMFQVGSRSSGEPIELAETGEMVELILKFIYPRQSPTIASFDLLEKALDLADKYQLDDMYQQLRQQLTSNGSVVSAYANPLKALGVASAHNLKEEIQVAASLAHENHDLTTIDGLLKLAKSAPAATTWIVVIGIPSVKSRVILEVLFNYHKLPSPQLCNVCTGHRPLSGTPHSPPEWRARWSNGLFTELMKRPVRDWKPCFEVAFLYDSIVRYGGTPIRFAQGVCTCLELLSQPPRSYDDFYDISDTVVPETNPFPDLFSQWSSSVYNHLTARLSRLEDLEKLVKE